MSHWNYRLVKYRDGSGFGVHEVYYEDDDTAWAMTTEGLVFGETAEEAIESLAMALADAKERPVFNEPDKWPERKKS